MDALITETEKKEQLITEGKLPDVPGIWPKFMALGGHKPLYGIWQPLEERIYRCTNCMLDWQGYPVADNPQMQMIPTCQQCLSANDVYQLNITDYHKWQCVECKYEWIAEDGRGCPNCGTFKS